MNTYDPTSAYLGPKLWTTLISHENLEDSDEGGEAVAMSDIFYNTVREEGSSPGPSSPASDMVRPHIRPSVIVPIRRDTVKIEPDLQSGANKFLYVESKRARLDREKMDRKRRLEVQLDFAPEDIALATVPGLEFDPKTRAFDMEEPRPQPIIKKRKKSGNARILKTLRPSSKSTRPISVKRKPPRIVISSVPSRPIASDVSPITSGMRPSHEPLISASSRSHLRS